jgi:hypothetical protein
MEQFVRQFAHTHEQVVNFYGETSKDTLTLAANYTLANKPFSGMTLQKKKEELDKLLTKGMNKTYSFRGNFLDKNFVAQFLIGNESALDLEEFSIRVRKLIDAGFPKKSSTLQAAIYLTSYEGHAERANELYQEMKKYRPFLTGISDIPISVFITQNLVLKSASVAKGMNDYYNDLKGTFKQGKALHQLSQLLVLWSPTYNEHAVLYITQLKLKLEKRKIRVNNKLYSLIGVLALNELDDHIIDDVIHVYNALINTKLLKSNKEIALQIAIKKIIQQIANETELISNEAGLKLSDLVDFLTYAEAPIEISKFILDHIILD